MSFGQACIVVAIRTSEWTPGLDIILKDAIEGTLVGVGEEPIQVVQLYVQHWYRLGMQDGAMSEVAHIPHSSIPTL